MSESLPRPEKFEIICERPSHLYHVQEQTIIAVKGPENTPCDITLSEDGGKILRTLKMAVPAFFCHSLDHPGFLRCSVAISGQPPLLCGAAYDPEMIQPAADEPEDFDDFWEDALSRLDYLPNDLQMEPLPSEETPEAVFYAVSCANWNGEKVYGFLKLPKGKKNVPLLVYFEGAGPGQCLETFCQHCQNVRQHLGPEVAALTIFTHNFKPGMSCEEHQKLYEAYLKKLGVSYWLEGLDGDITETFFYRMILGAVRLCNLVSALPQINRKRIAYLGASQGGGFGIYLTAMCPQIKAAFCGVPAFGDFAGGREISHQPQSNITEMNKYVDKLQYFDAVYFARRIMVPVFISLGYIDTACSPSSVMAIANNLSGPKLVFHKVEHGHGDAPVEYNNLTWFWVRQHLEND